MKKTLLSLVLVLLLAFNNVGTVCAATSGICGSNTRWSYSAGTLTISGSGSTNDIGYSNQQPGKDYLKSITKVVITGSITDIGSDFFRQLPNLTEITIPASVKEFREDVFEHTENIRKVNITSIAAWCGISFYDVDSNPLYQGADLYLNGELVKGLEIDGGIPEICDYAFYGCNSIESIAKTNGVESIGENAFANSQLREVNISESVRTIGNNAFSKTPVENVYMGNSVLAVGNGAFSGCTKLKSISLPTSLNEIPASMLAGCTSLQSFDVPSYISRVGSGALSGCTGLKRVSLPSGLTEIDIAVFSGCESLEYVNIPSGLKRIRDSAFAGCKKLSDITVPSSVTEIGTCAFMDCDSFTGIYINGEDVMLGWGAYANCNGFVNLTIPGSVGFIDSLALGECPNLETVYIPSSVKRIDSAAFYKSPKLKNISISSYNTKYSSHNGILFDKNKKSILTYPEGKQGEKYIIPNTVKYMGDRAFMANKYLKSVIIPDGVTTISELAFSGCENLIDITIPASVTSVGEQAFYGCEKLETVYYKSGWEEWLDIDISEDNGCLQKAYVEYYFGAEAPEYSISLMPSEAEIFIGETIMLCPYVKPNYAYKSTLNWSSNNPLVATVDVNGVVTAKGPGTAVITAVASNGKKASCIVTVRAPSKNRLDFDAFYYAFGNDAYSFGYTDSVFGSEKIKSIGQERYEQLGLSSKDAKDKYDKRSKEWGGNCYGMCVSLVLFYKNILKEEHYCSGNIETVPNRLSSYEVEGLNTKLIQMIELFQVSRCLGYKVDKLSEDLVVKEINAGNPCIMALKGGMYAHTVIIYGYTETERGYIFDVRDPNSEITEIAYEDGVWEARGINEVGYIPDYINTYKSIKKTYDKINKAGKAVSLFSIDAGEKNIYLYCSEDSIITNSAHETLNQKGGEIIGNITNAVMIYDLYIDEGIYEISLPADTYTITGSGDEVVTTSFADDYMSVEVTAKASTPITISDDLKTITLGTNAEDEYSIKYTTYDNIFDEMTLSGAASGEVTAVLGENGTELTGADTLSAEVTVSGEAVRAEGTALGEYNKVEIVCTETEEGRTLQLLCDDTELTEKAALPERQTVSVPVYDLEPGEYTEAQTLTFTKDDDTIIYYTTDGSEPSADNGIIYSLPVEINKSMTIKAVATKYGYNNSDPVVLEYILPVVNTPFASIVSGEYNNIITVELSTGDAEDTIYYTLDGSNPITDGILYTVPLVISKDTCLQAYTLKDGLVSEICRCDYVIKPQFEFYISNSLVNQSGELITTENITSLEKVRVTAEKLQSGEKTATFMLAFFDEDNKLLCINMKEAIITEDTALVEIPIGKDVSDAYKLKAYIWQDTSSMMPLCESYEQLIFEEEENVAE